MNENTKNIRTLGIVLFLIGTVVGISAAAKMPAAGETYPDTLNVFFVSIAIAIIGNILWRKSEREIVLAELEAHKNDTTNNPVALLKATVPLLEKLSAKMDEIKGMEICEEVDLVLDTTIHPFTERRKTFLNMLGQAKGSEVLLNVAYAERMLNRVWSAASDGHHIEAVNSLQESLDNYRKTVASLE